jgi:hypothetical protein
MTQEHKPRNGKLSIPLPFEDAIKAVLKVDPAAAVPSKLSTPPASKPPRKPG